MNTLTKMALGLIGQLRPQVAAGSAEVTTPLPTAIVQAGLPLMQALAKRQSVRQFDPAPLAMQALSNLLWAAAGAMSQNVYLFCASEGLATVIRAWIDRHALGLAMRLNDNQQVLLAQTVGHAKTEPQTQDARR